MSVLFRDSKWTFMFQGSENTAGQYSPTGTPPQASPKPLLPLDKLLESNEPPSGKRVQRITVVQSDLKFVKNYSAKYSCIIPTLQVLHLKPGPVLSIISVLGKQKGCCCPPFPLLFTLKSPPSYTVYIGHWLYLGMPDPKHNIREQHMS